MLEKQSTLRTAKSLVSCGLHTGEECRLTLHPADPDTGIVFITESGEIAADIRYVHGTHRGTTLCNGNVEVHTVEHLLAALAGMGVDNVRAEVEGPEIPICDGSSLPFVELIESAGVEEQDSPVRTYSLASPVWVSDGMKYVLASPWDGYRITELIGFPHPMIGEQAISLHISPETFKREIAPARTFCTSGEIDMILSQGLGKGGTEENVIIVYDDRYSVPLRFNDEFVRHKVLDMIGDLSLVGGRLRADVTGIKTSHTLNTELVKRIIG